MPRTRDKPPLKHPHPELKSAPSAAASGPGPAGQWRWLLGCLLGMVVVAAVALRPGGDTLTALLAVPLGGLAAASWWRQQRLQRQLSDARARQALLDQLLDVWQWQTDADHRLTLLRPPVGAASPSWAEGAPGGELLWQRFEDASQTLARRMAAHTPLSALQVQGRHGSVQPGITLAATAGDQPAPTWLLRGLPKLDARGQFAGYIGTAEPLGRDHGADQQARRGLDRLFHDGPVALCEICRTAADPGWHIRRTNPAARLLLGRGDSLGDDPGDAMAWPAALQRLQTQLPSTLAARLAEWADPSTAEVTADSRSDAEGWTLWTCSLDGGEAGATALNRLLAISRADADDQARALAQEQATFSYTISHDLRAPIRVVDGFASILKEDYGGQLDRIGIGHLDRVQAAAARMNHMIDALLSLSKLSTRPLARVAVDLSDLATQVLQDLQRSDPERKVKIQIQPGMRVVGDGTLLHLVLENLLGNAWKYSARLASSEISFGQIEQGGRHVFEVRDNGAGFDMRSAHRLFGVFARLHGSSEFPGHGVGLASVQRIVRRHGGEIWAEAEPDRGARFYFTLKT